MVLDVLRGNLGPAAEDFAEDQCAEMGIGLDELDVDHREEFAALVEKNAADATSEFDAEYMAGVIRNLGD